LARRAWWVVTTPSGLALLYAKRSRKSSRASVRAPHPAIAGTIILTKRGCCCGAPPECVPCAIPHRDIILSWDNTFHGPGSGTLAYLGGDSWSTFVRGNILADGSEDRFTISCTDGNITFILSVHTEMGLLTSCSMTLNDGDDFTCDPFHLHYLLSGHSTADCYRLSGSFADPHAGYTDVWFD
jgi:hypothetical protein